MSLVPRLARLLAAVLAALALAGCGGDGDDAAPMTTTTTTDAATTTQPEGTTGETDTGSALERGTVTIETAEGPVEVAVEIADSDAERETGLMNRESLAEDAGMLFVFDEDVDFAFWMKNTLIPLSIAFADAEGEIVRILDMEPCEADPCPVYDPEATYRTALEVNQGAFDEWGVAEGDPLALDR
jgi:uncharacterized membrane protein (UPF0127 family)